ncbi:chaperone protein HscA homolog [Striga asiatica]|uniref:Chaperone protein HscA homolog n=1 Tax=Striga asiatica TaxID=4170 RepID=A0A5A7PFU5_STRAF|nr:chaperone protein HscA homolog [Striga asiatica]
MNYLSIILAISSTTSSAFLAPATSNSANLCKCPWEPASMSLLRQLRLPPAKIAATTATGNFFDTTSFEGSNIRTILVRLFSSLTNSFPFDFTESNETKAFAPTSCIPSGFTHSISLTRELIQPEIARLLPSLMAKLASREEDMCCIMTFL